MHTRHLVPALIVAGVLATGCGNRDGSSGHPDEADASTVALPPRIEPATSPATNPPAVASSIGAPAAAAAPTSTATVLASQETNWPGIIAEVTEFRRRGNTLTARVRLRNAGSETVASDVEYNMTYLMDAAAGKKYEVLRDENDHYIAALSSGWSNRWYEDVEPGMSQTIWMKFPAPPPEVTTVTLQIPGMPPFDDLAIQDG